MLDLRNMSDEEFTIVVTPSVPQTATHVTIDESGKVYLSSKVAEKFARKPVQISFNQGLTAIQLAQMAEETIRTVLYFLRTEERPFRIPWNC